MSVKEEIKQRYDTFAGQIYKEGGGIRNPYTDISPVVRYFRQRKIETALRLGGFKRGDRILEVGSNMGQYTTLLAEKGFSMAGIDLSDKAVEAAKKLSEGLNFKNIDYFPMDAEDLSTFKDETFDGVVSF